VAEVTKLAIMQPYFLPYIGYWQLIHAADTFVLLDDVQYIRHGWVNRNRVLKPGGGWQYIAVPIRKHSPTAPIRDIRASPDRDWKALILRQLAHYRYHGRAPYYDAVVQLLAQSFSTIADERLSVINASLVRDICAHLELPARIVLSSELGLSYADVHAPGDWALSIARSLGAAEYINPIGGAALFDAGAFASNGIRLSFLRCGDVQYDQRAPHESSLSIVDVLMFNGRDGTRDLLERYSIEPAPPASPALSSPA
jgi:hypothetical protein